MTKVLYCHPGAEMYGSDRMALETVKALLKRGAEVIVVLPEEGELSRRLTDANADVRILKVPVLRKEYLKPFNLVQIAWRSVVGLMAALRLIRSLQVDTVVVNTVTQPVWIAAARLARKSVICHVREAEDSLGRALRAALVFPLSFTSLILSNSKATEAFLRRSTILPLPEIRVIYNGKDWGGYYRSNPDLAKSAIRLIVVGRISPRKGQDTAIQTLGILRQRGVEADLRIVGDVFPGYEWYRSSLDEEADRLQISQYVSFSGFVQDIAAELQHADIALVPSRAEPFGTVAAESMAAMRCTVVSSVQGLVEIVEDRVSGLCVDAENADQWADAIESLIKDPTTAHALARAGHERVRDIFSIEAYSDGIHRALERVREASK